MVLVAVIAFLLLPTEALIERFASISGSEGISADARTEIWENTFALIRDYQLVAAEPTADERIIAELRALRRLMLRHPPGNNQRAAALFMANGHYDVLVRRIHRVYRERWDAMAQVLNEHLPGWSRSPGFGGSSYWLTGPEGLDSEALAERALSEGVIIEPGTPFYLDPEEGRMRFRLGFSSIPSERIGEGIRRLGQVIGPVS